MDIHLAVQALIKLGKDFAARRTYLTEHLPLFVAVIKAQKTGKANFAKSSSVITYFRETHKLNLDRTEAQLIAASYRNGPPAEPVPKTRHGHRKDIKITTSTGVIEQPFMPGRTVKHG